MPIRSHLRGAMLCGILGLALLAGGCRKETVTAPPPVPPSPPVPAARPTVTFEATPAFIQRGESSTLKWSSTNATQLQITPGIGSVAAEGSTRVSPTESTTYTITVSGPGGSASESARITVGASPPPAPPRDAAMTIEELFRANVFDAYFDYDKADIRADAREALAKTAQFLRAQPEIRIVIEGHCDERGSTEYNLALGARRAEAARQFLISLGVAPGRMETVSWGKERPFCFDSHEGCWQTNRRAHFVMAR
jgi:peptidoglycan-associated lipoprotein